MVLTGADPVGNGALSSKRAEYAGPTGLKGLIASPRVTAIAVFASMGGLVYGCECCDLPCTIED